MEIPAHAFTHGGKFHSDDVFGAALLTYLRPDIQIERGFKVPENYDGLVFDIGFGRFDHHQSDARVRENGVPYAAFGLLFEEFGKEILSEEEAAKFDEHFIQPLDLSDNTGCENAIASMIDLYNPFWNENASADEQFEKAKEVALEILTRTFEKIKSTEKATNLVAPDVAKAKDHIVILSHFAPWKKAVEGTDVEYVIYHSQRGGFSAQCVNDEFGKMKRPFDEKWRGLEGEELQEASGIKGLRFCHKSGFLLAGETIDDLLRACHKMQEK